ncbi:major facilitator superfamily domain-containing protein [Lentinula aciculospora]|uniref:Major facilitator superfamily domain-containing protein n=1 Tax=Lentinula aciculospora TaxID=153920 RepID=A0A9W9DJP9_9AGAR|nr:major facilitator superfamily domain-containing protein [Lentinula aciculospora]
MADLFRDTAAGQIVRYLSRGRLLPYLEDSPDFSEVVCEKSPHTKKFTFQVVISDQQSSMEPSDSQERTLFGDNQSPPQTLNEENDPNLVSWYGPDDPENPLNWSTPKKFFVTGALSFMTFSVYVGSNFTAYFHTNLTVATLGLTLFVFGYGIGPMFLSSLTEIPQIGRSPPYLVSLGIFFILQIPTVLATNVPGFLILRFLGGFWGSPPLATGGASIGDIFPPSTRAYAIGAWGTVSICGPVLGPLIGGFASGALGWRWSLWPLLFLCGGTWLFLMFALPETSAGNILYKRRLRLVRLRQRRGIEGAAQMTVGEVLKATLIRPFQLMIMEPIVLSLNLYMALLYAILYCWFESIPIVFGDVYHFTLGLQGTSFIGILIGAIVVYAVHCVYMKKVVAPAFEEGAAKAHTLEDRLVGACFGCWWIPICLFWFGWTSTASVHWIVPIVGSSLFNLGMFLVYTAICNYLPDAYPVYAASVLAGNGLLRAVVGGAFPLFARAMFVNLQKNGPKAFPVAWGMACLAAAMIPIPFVLYKYGKWIRHHSKYALHDD